MNFHWCCIKSIDYYMNHDTFKLNVYAHKHNIILFIWVFLMFFNEVIQFSGYKVYVSFVRFISRFVKVFVTIQWCLSKMKFSNLWLLVNRVKLLFIHLYLYLAKLFLFFIPSNLFVNSFQCSMKTIISL